MENTMDPQIQHVKGAIEALLFVNEKPVTLDQIRNALDTVQPAEIKRIISLLQQEYENRKSGISIIEIAGGYQMLSNPLFASYIREFYKTKHKERLSKPALETLAIIAYKQPVTRADIELIRGVNSDGVFANLVEKELIKIVGRKDIAGRPFMYGTTKQFMEYFGLKSLDDLPKLEEFPALQSQTDKEEIILDQLTGQPLNSMELAKQRAVKQAAQSETSQFKPQDFSAVSQEEEMDMEEAMAEEERRLAEAKEESSEDES